MLKQVFKTTTVINPDDEACNAVALKPLGTEVENYAVPQNNTAYQTCANVSTAELTVRGVSLIPQTDPPQYALVFDAPLQELPANLIWYGS